MKPSYHKSSYKFISFHAASLLLLCKGSLSNVHRSQHYGTVFLEKSFITRAIGSDTEGKTLKRVSLTQLQGKI